MAVVYMTGACDSGVQKTTEILQVQYIHRIADVPVVMQRQVPTMQTVQETVEGPQSQCLDRVVDVLVVMWRQSSMIQKVAINSETPRSRSLTELFLLSS